MGSYPVRLPDARTEDKIRTEMDGVATPMEKGGGFEEWKVERLAGHKTLTPIRRPDRKARRNVSACESRADGDAHLFLIYGEPRLRKTRLSDE